MSEYDTNLASTKETTDKRCPKCGGVMNFNPKEGNLKCPYCDHTMDVENVLPAAMEIDLKEAEFLANKNWGTKTKTVICKSCSGESIYDSLEIANVCPYCGSNHVMEENDIETMAPGGVVLFKVTAKDAGDLFQKWLSTKWFCPPAAKISAKPDKFKGIYLPHWTFDTNTNSFYTAEAGINKERTKSDGKTETYTKYYKVRGNFKHSFDDFIESGTSRFDKYRLNAIEPFDTANNSAYKPEYIAGFVAERYSIGLEEAWKNAQTRMKTVIESKITDKIIYEEKADSVRGLSAESSFNDVKFKYLLLPIWVSAYVYNNKRYEFMVNGQTGKVSGSSPVDKVKVAIVIIVIIIIIGAIYYFNNQ